MQRVIAYKWLVSLGISLVYCLAVLPFTESAGFHLPVSGQAPALLRVVLKIAFGLTVTVAVALLIDLSARLRAGDVRTRYGLAVAGVYFVVLLAVWFLVYPGQWAYDEFFVLEAAKNYEPYTWQHYFTTVFHTFCLYLVPTGVGIVLIQMLVGAAVVGYLVSGVRETLRTRRLALLVALPFLLLPALFEVYHPLRLTIYSFVALLAVGKLLLLLLAPEQAGNRYRELLGYSVLLTLMAFWRTEGIFYLVFLPVAAVRLGLLRELLARRGRAIATVMASLAVVGAGFVLTQVTSRPEYQLTALYNPLSVMVSEDLTGGDVERYLALIDTVMDVDQLRQHPDYSDIPGYWAGGALRPDFEEHLGEFYRGVAGLISHNPGAFLDARWKTFLATNSLDPSVPYVPTGLIFETSATSPMLATFDENNWAAEPIDQGLRVQVMRFLLQMEPDGHGTAARAWTWTVIPTLIGLVVLAAAGVVRRRWHWVLLPLAVLAHAGIVFMTAPAYYFMYYVPVFYVGNVLILVALVRAIDRAQRRRADRPDEAPAEPPLVGATV